MSKVRQRYDEDFKKNAVKLSYATSKTIKDFAADLGINPALIYNWRKIYTNTGDKTKLAEQEDSLRQLQIENAVLKRQGYTASYKRVSEIMKRLGLVSIHNKRCQRSLTDSRNAKVKNWVNLIQGLKSFEPFQVITSDISYVRTLNIFVK